ncbi:MAG TPA: MFS transporter [Candidatus Sulfotelmatobacter sp.]|jgi:metabolite-proton symporter|nr:MFS transporter [Candidatus Sulfotelmatobacter sp.]
MMTDEKKPQSTVLRIVQVASGNFLEMYDFMVFGYYATAIGKTFFPSTSDFASLMAVLMTFGVGYMMRPLGAFFLGAYIDRHGRRRGLILTLTLMAVGMLMVACIPGYETLGFVAPLIVFLGRILQGFSAGVELGGVSVYLSEIAPPDKKGFYVSWQSASLQCAVITAGLIGWLLSLNISPQQMNDWGWRIPLLAGCMIVPVLLRLRRTLRETEEFEARTKKHQPQLKEIFRSIASNWQLVLMGMLIVSLSNAAFYMITAYTPTFGQHELHLSSTDSLLVTLCIGVSNFIFVPIGGALSDKFGRRPVMVLAALVLLATAYPVLDWLTQAPSLERMLLAEFWLSIVYAQYNGAMIVYVTEIMPVEVRTAGFSLAYGLSQTVFGGFTPAICTYLIHETGNKAMPGVWISVAAVCALSSMAALALYQRSLNKPALAE